MDGKLWPITFRAESAKEYLDAQAAALDFVLNADRTILADEIEEACKFIESMREVDTDLLSRSDRDRLWSISTKYGNFWSHVLGQDIVPARRFPDAPQVRAKTPQGFLSDPTEHRVQLPENMSKSWKEEWFPEYQKARRNSERWSAMTGIITATSKELCGKFKNRGGLKAITLRALMENEVPDDALLRMLVARRVILSYWDLVNTRAQGYEQLIRELGFVSKDQADLGSSTPAIQEENFRNYLSSIGLKKKTIQSPLDSEGLLEEEVEWFKSLFPPD
ncbi:hypothetical protein IT157_10970 [bacterium]|nr:hypothetical protein [bacterium]